MGTRFLVSNLAVEVLLGGGYEASYPCRTSCETVLGQKCAEFGRDGARTRRRHILCRYGENTRDSWRVGLGEEHFGIVPLGSGAPILGKYLV